MCIVGYLGYAYGICNYLQAFILKHNDSVFFVMHVLCELLYVTCYNKKLNDKKRNGFFSISKTFKTKRVR